MCLVLRGMRYIGIIQAGNQSQEKLEDDSYRLCMNAHFWFYMAEAPSLECQSASLPLHLYCKMTNSRTVDIFKKSSHSFLDSQNLISFLWPVVSLVSCCLLGPGGRHLVFGLHWAALSTALWAWGSPHTPRSPKDSISRPSGN